MSTPTSNGSAAAEYESKAQINHSEGAPLQNMVTLTAAQYESLYLTPKDARASPGVTATFANPVGIGTIALVLVVLPWSLGQCNVAGTNAISYITLAPALIFSGFVMLILAGTFAWVQGLTFPCYVFLTYGGFAGLLWYLNAPIGEMLTTQGGLLTSGQASGVAAFGAAAASKEFNHALMCVLIPFTIMSGIFFLASLRTNVVNAGLFLSLLFFFAFECGNFYQAGNGNVARALTLQKVAGGWGISASICAAYLSMHLTFASTNLPIPVPLLDLSTWGVKKQGSSLV